MNNDDDHRRDPRKRKRKIFVAVFVVALWHRPIGFNQLDLKKTKKNKKKRNHKAEKAKKKRDRSNHFDYGTAPFLLAVLHCLIGV